MSDSLEPSPAPAAGPSTSSRRSFIRLGDNVLLKLPSGVLKPVKITANGTISLGKYGSFKGNLLVDHPYGHTYEIDPATASIHPIEVALNDVEETDANNQLIASTGAQALTFDDIQALKDSGLTGREIIQRQIDEHKAFELKTEYSKDKYLKRKQAKYLQLFTPLEPTVHQIAQFNFDRQASKTRELRPDTLANMLAMANVRPGSRLLVVEDLGGMVVAAAVERMGGAFSPFLAIPQSNSIFQPWTSTHAVSPARPWSHHDRQRRRLSSRPAPPRILQFLPPRSRADRFPALGRNARELESSRLAARDGRYGRRRRRRRREDCSGIARRGGDS